MEGLKKLVYRQNLVMSDIKEIKADSESTQSKLSICLFPSQQQLTQTLTKFLDGERYQLNFFNTSEEFIDFVRHHQEEIDCLIFVNKNCSLETVLSQIWDLGIFLPLLIIELEPISGVLSSEGDKSLNFNETMTLLSDIYHGAEVHLYPIQLEQISSYINLAISKFLNLAPSGELNQRQTKTQSERSQSIHDRLKMQQRFSKPRIFLF